MTVKSSVRRISSEEGVLRQIEGSFLFILKEGDLRHGSFSFQLKLSDGTEFEIDCRAIYNIYDTFNSIARTDPEDLAKHISEVNESAEASSKTYQKAYDAHLREKYPGWPDKLSRKREPATSVATDKLNVEDLGL